MSDTQFQRYFNALRGSKLYLGEGYDPPSGFYRMRRWRNDPPPPFQRTLAIWREDGKILVEVNYKGVKEMTAEEADELFYNPDLVAISHKLYEEIRSGGVWPDVHTTYLRTKDIKEGLHWTEEWSRKQLAAQVATHDEHGERREPVGGLGLLGCAALPLKGDVYDQLVGHNNPPADLVREIRDRLNTVAEAVAKDLNKWGGKPRDKDEADRCAVLINAMRDIGKDADHRRVNEKEVFLKGGREVDAKWRGVIDDAKRYADKLKTIATEWLEKAEAEAKAATVVELAKVREETGIEPEPPSEEPKIRIGSGRQISIKTREMYQVTDPKLFFDHLFEKNIEMSNIMVEAHKLANKLAANGLPVPGVDRIQQRKAS